MATKRICIGQFPLKEWTNVHFDSRNLETCLKLPYKKCSISEVYVKDVLEKLPYNLIIPAIAEWRRVLIVGGRLVIVFPDVIKAAFLYKRNAMTFEQLQDALIGGYRTALAMEKIENLLLMRFSMVNEVHYLPQLRQKKIWQTILIAEKHQEK